MTTLPNFIKKDDPDFSPNDIAAVIQGGCASGAYMPAVTYATAAETMHEHGDEVLEYIEGVFGEIPSPPDGESWKGIAVFYLSTAVETWCLGHEHLADWEDEEPLEGRDD